MPGHVRLIRRTSKEHIEWAGLAGSLSGLPQPADSQLRPRVIRAVCLIAGVAAAAYLWAVFFGDALHGLKLGSAIDKADSLPNANLAFVAALVVYAASPWAAWWWADFTATRNAIPKWYGLTAIAGALLFAVSRMFV